MNDVSLRVTPVTDRDVSDMLTSLNGFRLLTGYRGAAPVDIAALGELLHRIDALAEDLPELVELDLNPVILHEAGLVVVDVRARIRSLPPSP